MINLPVLITWAMWAKRPELAIAAFDIFLQMPEFIKLIDESNEEKLANIEDFDYGLMAPEEFLNEALKNDKAKAEAEAEAEALKNDKVKAQYEEYRNLNENSQENRQKPRKELSPQVICLLEAEGHFDSYAETKLPYAIILIALKSGCCELFSRIVEKREDKNMDMSQVILNLLTFEDDHLVSGEESFKQYFLKNLRQQDNSKIADILSVHALKEGFSELAEEIAQTKSKKRKADDGAQAAEQEPSKKPRKPEGGDAAAAPLFSPGPQNGPQFFQ